MGLSHLTRPKNAQTCRGDHWSSVTNAYHRTPPLSVILSARSTRSFLQSSEASSKKSRSAACGLRRRDLQTITNSSPRANELFRVHKRYLERTYCAARSDRAGASVALRASWAFRLLHNQFFHCRFGKHTQDDRGESFSVGISCGRPMVAPTNKHLNSRGAHCASETNAHHRTTEKRTNL